ncbi:MAG: histidine kinase N-terminal 7TM domain-containing protein [Vicinamibacterales bacterium]
MQAGLFSLVYLVAGLVAFAAAVVVWPRRHAPGGLPLTCLLLSVSWWALCDTFEVHAQTVEARQLISQIQYFGVVSASPLFFMAARELTGSDDRLRPGLLLAVWGIPLTALVMAWTNPWHHAIWTAIDLTPGGTLALYRYGWFFWILMAQHYALNVAAAVLLIRSLSSVAHDFRQATAVVLVVIGVPWVANVISVFKLGPWPGFDLVAIAVGISGGLLAWLVLRQGLLDLVPQARAAYMLAMSDAVMVLDARGREVFANRAADDPRIADRNTLVRLMGYPSWTPVPDTYDADVTVPGGTLSVRIVPVADRWGARSGRLIVARFIDPDAEPPLHHAGAHLLPICAGCHRLRTELGRWVHAEAYRSPATQVEFTHGICPVCIAKLYPELSAAV